MDPQANIKRQRELAAEIQAASDEGEYFDAWDIVAQAQELAELSLALDEWRRKGGFDPYAGQPPQRQDSLTDQLRDVAVQANAMGCYDAADHIRRDL